MTFLAQPYPRLALLCSPLDSASPLKVTSSLFAVSGPLLFFSPSVGRLKFLTTPSVNASETAYAFVYSKENKNVAAVLYDNSAIGPSTFSVSAGNVESVAMTFEDSVNIFFLIFQKITTIFVAQYVGSIACIIWIETLSSPPPSLPSILPPKFATILIETTVVPTTAPASSDGGDSSGNTDGGENGGRSHRVEGNSAQVRHLSDQKKPPSVPSISSGLPASRSASHSRSDSPIYGDRDVFVTRFDDAAFSSATFQSPTVIWANSGDETGRISTTVVNGVYAVNGSDATSRSDFSLSVTTLEADILKFEMMIVNGEGFMRGIGGAFSIYDGQSPGLYPVIASSDNPPPNCPGDNCRFYSTGNSFSVIAISSRYITNHASFFLAYRPIRAVALSPNFLYDRATEKGRRIIQPFHSKDPLKKTRSYCDRPWVHFCCCLGEQRSRCEWSIDV